MRSISRECRNMNSSTTSKATAGNKSANVLSSEELMEGLDDITHYQPRLTLDTASRGEI